MAKNNSKADSSNKSYDNKRRGDRVDGWILKDLSSFTKLVPHLMPTREAASIYIKEKVDVTNFVKYVEEKNIYLANNPIKVELSKTNNSKNNNNNNNSNNNANYINTNNTNDDNNIDDNGNNSNNKNCANSKNITIDKITYFNVFMSSLVRLFTVKPHMNRFIASRKHYQRKKIELAFVAKKEFTEDGEETIIKKSFNRDETLWSIAGKLNKDIKQVKTGKEDSAGDLLDLVAKFPNPIIHFFIRFLDFLNYIGKYPKDIHKEDPMHCSAFVSNLGSIGVRNVPYHHLYDRGTCSVFICLGEIHKDKVYNSEIGDFVERDFVEISATIDERISDGFYYINAMNTFKEILNNPEILEKECEHIPIDR
ncbi:MAG: 2-oxo acid dehydrogenase subunit E2 [Methanobacteriaceae archaeon]